MRHHLHKVPLHSAGDHHNLPHNFCYERLNKTNCGGPPTYVFTYYQEGSRCEIDIWKGCPSRNRFDNEAICSHFCIGRLRYNSVENEISEEQNHTSYCDGQLNSTDCGLEREKVYTFDRRTKSCIPSVWRGCPSTNMFRREQKCEEQCLLIKRTVPPEYCFKNLNRTDCGGKPTHVFTYYREGSRCEIEVWKGCPTRNRFDSEATCSHFCIGRLRYEENEIPDEPIKNPCKGTFNGGDCSSSPLEVYTYDQQSNRCVKRIWKGCTGSNQNMFKDEIQCMDMCVGIDRDWWVDKLNNLTSKEQHDIDKVLEVITEESTTDGSTTEDSMGESMIEDATEIPTTTLDEYDDENFIYDVSNETLDDANAPNDFTQKKKLHTLSHSMYFFVCKSCLIMF
ncbi:uncharacterized protein LOC126367346 isoform X1 [Pectinophora gossypiella]|uniref:uncharacterized protein LOC126367346 isoform X1 n=1 Tax=Pectinophora gossypiella TaxID=13191 RepID=UPI00214F3C01|nr:uncharacterized protein LOC126367346 isoform X1 [Pectinophora gossypiella]